MAEATRSRAVVITTALLGVVGALGGAWIGGEMAIRAANQQAAAAERVRERTEVERAMREYLQAVDAGIELYLRLGQAAALPLGTSFDARVSELRAEIGALSRRLQDTYLGLQLIVPDGASDIARDMQGELVRNGNLLNDFLDIRKIAPSALTEIESAARQNSRMLEDKRTAMLKVFKEELRRL